jgi:hypothetical protein
MQGAALVFCAFSVTVAWFLYKAPPILRADFKWDDIGNNAHEWLEPLAAIFAGLGAFTLAVLLIIRRIESGRDVAAAYGLARGLATGYYFNFVEPLLRCLHTSDHPLHAEAQRLKASRIAGLIVGFPQARGEFEPTGHDTHLQAMIYGPAFVLHRNLRVDVAGRPRPLFVHLAVSTNGTGILMDLPTTLAVIPNFADFIAAQESASAGSGSEQLAQARADFVSSSEATEFQRYLDEFVDTFMKVGSQDPARLGPIARLVHVVPFSSMRARMEEVVRA